ncbi:hypothetical protein HMI51_02650 [Corallococcus coralloides]|nr:hypothetical protein [Corallococcus coralloides]
MGIPDHDFQLLTTCGDESEAALVRALLQADNIPCIVQGEQHRSMLGVVGAYIELRVLVPASEPVGQLRRGERRHLRGLRRAQRLGRRDSARPEAQGHRVVDPPLPVRPALLPHAGEHPQRPAALNPAHV